jgi:hypothetical protein
MNRHLNRLPESFDPENPEPDQALDDGTVDVAREDSATGDPDGPPREPGG